MQAIQAIPEHTIECTNLGGWLVHRSKTPTAYNLLSCTSWDAQTASEGKHRNAETASEGKDSSNITAWHPLVLAGGTGAAVRVPHGCRPSCRHGRCHYPSPCWCCRQCCKPHQSAQAARLEQALLVLLLARLTPCPAPAAVAARMGVALVAGEAVLPLARCPHPVWYRCIAVGSSK